MISLKTGEVAALINVTKRTLQNWLVVGKIPPPHKGSNGYYLWTESEVRAAQAYLLKLKATTHYRLRNNET